ncbi:hypothetical protein TB2_022174 [Malus domestica]
MKNMMAFCKNSGLLLILIPRVLFGNTLLPSCLRFSIWVLGTLFTKKKQLCNYVLKNTGDWVPTFATKPPLITFGCHSFWVDCGTMGTTFILGVEFRQLKWTKSLPENHWRFVPKCEFKTCRGNYPDLSITSPAILVLFVVMM